MALAATLNTGTRNPADEILHVLLGTEEGRQDPYLLYRALRDIARCPSIGIALGRAAADGSALLGRARTAMAGQRRTGVQGVRLAP